MSKGRQLSGETAIDILIVGDGIAGCCAAISAHEAGARVLVIDKAPSDVPHGNTAFSGGAFRRVSADYSQESFYSDLLGVSGNKADPRVARLLVDQSAEAQNWLEMLGVHWTAETRFVGPTAESENRGTGLAAAIRGALRQRPVSVLDRTEALSLIREQDQVVGVRVRNADGGESEVRAGAVILASGGFGANSEMVKRYIGAQASNLIYRGSPFNTGDGLRMAEALGAKLDWMDDFHGGLLHYGYKEYPEQGAKSGMRHLQGYEVGILVNKLGNRFVDEGEDVSLKTYVKFGKIIALTQPKGVAYVVFDARSRDTVDPVYKGPGSKPIEAASISELAATLEIPANALEKTIAEFNLGVRDGRCLSVTPPKTNFARPISVPPFCAHKVTGGMTMTFGGLRTEQTGEVLDVNGAPIRGLFAVGEITTGLFYGNYAGGSSLTKCTILGRICGKAATEYALHRRAH